MCMFKIVFTLKYIIFDIDLDDFANIKYAIFLEKLEIHQSNMQRK